MRSHYDINVAHIVHCIIILMIRLSCLLQVQKLCHVARTLASAAWLLWNYWPPRCCFSRPTNDLLHVTLPTVAALYQKDKKD